MQIKNEDLGGMETENDGMTMKMLAILKMNETRKLQDCYLTVSLYCYKNIANMIINYVVFYCVFIVLFNFFI